jgi:hypothetical protein
MPNADNLASDSVTMSLGIALIAMFLGLRQWYDHRGRAEDLSEADCHYLHRQDVRRAVGVGMMLILAAGIVVGARIEPRVNGRANVAYVGVWLTVVGLLLASVLLAGVDWLATSRYARQQRRAIAEERVRLLHDMIRESADSHGDQLDQHDPSAE